MSKISIISVGKVSSEYIALNHHWLKMITFDITERIISPQLGSSPDVIKKNEALQIAKYIPHIGVSIALDPAGVEMDSHQFAKYISNNLERTKHITFVIGGAYGLDKTLLDSLNSTLSLSKLTLPHLLAKLVLLEQIYRAQTIIQGHPYHK